MKFEKFKKIMSENGINSLAECARELRVSPQSISNWKARGWIPPKYEIIINNDFDLKNKNQNKEKKIDNDFIDLESKNNFFSLSNIILPIAKNLSFTIKSTFLMGFLGLLIFLVFQLLGFLLKNEDPTKTYITTSKIVIPGGVQLVQNQSSSSSSSGILGMLGINRSSSSGGGSSLPPTSTLTSPSLYPQFLRTHSFAKRLFEEKFNTNKYGEQTLLEIVLLELEESFNKPSGLLKSIKYPTGYIVYKDENDLYKIDRGQGLDTLVMQYMHVINDTLGTGLVEFNQMGSFQTITTRAIEPKLAVDIAYVVLEELQEFTDYFNKIDLNRTEEFIEQRLKVIQDEYTILEDKMKIFLETNRQINSPALLIQKERIDRDLAIYKGLYTTLYQNLEQVKIQKEYEMSPTIQILDHPIPPLAPIYLNVSYFKTLSPIVILGFMLIGFGFGIIFSLIKGYLNIIDKKEKQVFEEFKNVSIKSIKSIFK